MKPEPRLSPQSERTGVKGETPSGIPERIPRISGIGKVRTRSAVRRIVDVVSSYPPPVLDAETLYLLQERFHELAGENNHIDVTELAVSMRLEDPFLAKRVLEVLDCDGDGLVSRAEFQRRVPRLLFGCLQDKLKFVFRLHDCNADGLLDLEELRLMVKVGLQEEGATPTPELVERFASVVMTAADTNGDRKISRQEFESLALCHPRVIEIMAEAELTWFGQTASTRETVPQKVQRWLNAANDNRSSIAFVALWIAATAGVALAGAYKYRAGGSYLMTARACGAALNLNIGLVLLATARVVMTKIRKTPLRRFVPVDHAMSFHQLAAYSVVVFASGHTVAHVLHRRASGVAIGQWIASDWFAATGVVLMAILGVIAALALPKVRASGRFEWFRRSHLLYPAWLFVALIHGRHLWMWALFPVGLFVIDRAVRSFAQSRDTEVIALQALVSGVTKVTLVKPEGFAHNAGDYMYLKLPRLAAGEWHPFTISSSPENPILTLHVRSLGDYTRKLYQMAVERANTGAIEPIPASIEGPFGTASADILESEVAVMVAGGIGVTPFASVLESIILRTSQRKPSKVYFYWLNREGSAFAWFFGLLSELEHRDTHGLVDIRVFMTRGQERSTAVVLNLARSIVHGYGGKDHVTGLRTQTRMGAPNFRTELGTIVEDHPNRCVDVFFCGPPGLARVLRQECAALGLAFRQEHF